MQEVELWHFAIVVPFDGLHSHEILLHPMWKRTLYNTCIGMNNCFRSVVSYVQCDCVDPVQPMFTRNKIPVVVKTLSDCNVPFMNSPSAEKVCHNPNRNNLYSRNDVFEICAQSPSIWLQTLHCTIHIWSDRTMNCLWWEFLIGPMSQVVYVRHVSWLHKRSNWLFQYRRSKNYE